MEPSAQASSMKTALPVFIVTQFGASGDGKTDNTGALRGALAACQWAGGGTVVVPPGIYLTGPLELSSRTTLYLEAGALILASPRLEDYPPETGSFSMESDRPGLITARDAEMVTITGRGVIDGNGFAFVDPERPHMGKDFDRQYTRQGQSFLDPQKIEHGPLAHGDRPGNLLRFYQCKNVLIEGVTIQNSPTWTIHVNRCEQVNILGVNINSQGSGFRVPNDDGIDLALSARIHIANCDIHTGDDCIAVFGSRQLTVENCTLTSQSSGIRVGFDRGDTRDCTFSNLVIDSNRGINVCVRGEGSIENISFANIIIRTRLFTGHWWGKGEPIHISAMPWNPEVRALGHIRRIIFRNIVAEGESGVLIYGCPQSPIRDVIIDSLLLTIKNSPLHNSYGGNFDLRSTDNKATALFKHDIPGLYAGHFERLTIRGMELSWQGQLPDFFTHGLQFEHFSGLSVEGFRGGPAHPVDCQAIVFNDGNGVEITGVTPHSSAEAG